METVLKPKRGVGSKRIPKLNMLELVSAVSQRYEKSLLRRQIVPQGFCYVCSKIDPGGIFRRPNSYMFRKGFFAACEHFPKAPYTTFIEENPEEDDVIIDHALAESEMEDGKRTAAPSISVQIRRSSNLSKHTPSERLGRGSSMDKYGRDSSRSYLKSVSSPDKTGRESSRDMFGRPYESYAERQSRDSKRTTRLPVITQRDTEGTRSYKATSSKSQNQQLLLSRGSTDTSIEMNRLRALSSRLVPPASRKTDTEEEHLILPETEGSHKQHGAGHAGSIHLPDVHMAELASDGYMAESEKSEHSVITGVSTFSKGQTTTQSSSAEPAEPDGLRDTSVSLINEKSAADTRLSVYHTRPIINDDDGLDHTVVPAIPVLKDLFGMNARGSVADRLRPKAGRKREPLGRRRNNGQDSDTDSEGRPGSGRLRYHHRGIVDSVPYPGFEIPPTPTAEELAEIERLETEQIEQELAEEEKRHLEKLVAEGKVFDIDRSSKGLTDEDSVIISDNASLKRIHSLSGKKIFCRCPTEIRIIASSQICKHCGKVVGKSSRQNEQKSRTDFETEFPFSRSMGSTVPPSRNSREKMLDDQKLAGRVLTRTVSDEDYMDLESIIQDDDARYWSTDEEDQEGTSHATTTSSLLRLRNAKPYPLVNPDIHKEVYIRALNEVQYRDMKKSSGTRFDEHKKLRRPTVFSYFQLWPFAGKCDGCGNDLGIRPDNTFSDKKLKQGQLMKHIFGDVKIEDYYPGGSKSNEPRIVLDSLRTNDRSMTKSIDASVINSGKRIKRAGILFEK